MVSLIKVFKGNGSTFYLLFDEVSNNLVEMSRIFVASVHEEQQTIRNSQLRELQELESKNNLLTHNIFIELGEKFITPFDREDIHALTTSLDGIADYMYATMKQISCYGIVTIPHSTKNVSNNLHKLVRLIEEAIKKLKNKNHLEHIYALCIDMKKTAVLCTSLTDAGISRLYLDETDPIEVIKKTDHYELVYVILDKCYACINVLESIIVKYS